VIVLLFTLKVDYCWVPEPMQLFSGIGCKLFSGMAAFCRLAVGILVLIMWCIIMCRW